MEAERVKDFEEFRARQKKLTEKAERNELAAEELMYAVSIQRADGGFFGDSLGGNWIINNPQEFARIVPDVYTFLVTAARQEPYIFGNLILLKDELIALIPRDRLENFVETIFKDVGARNDDWVKTCLGAGISSEFIAMLVYDKLQASVPDIDEGEMTIHYGHYFLEYGIGHAELTDVDGRKIAELETETLWSVFPDDWLEEALMICLEKTPKSVLQFCHHIEYRLGKEKADRFRIEAARCLKDVIHQKLGNLRRLPLAERVALCKRLQPSMNSKAITVYLIVDTLIALRATGTPAAKQVQRQFLEEVWPKLDAIEVPILYRSSFAVTKDLPPIYRTALEERLRTDGFVCGQARREKFQPKNGPERTQLVVVSGNTKYVKNNRQYGFFVRDGEAILIDGKRSKFLTKHGGLEIRIADFIPTTRENRF